MSGKKRKAPDDPGDPPYDELPHCRAELDTHADTCAFGDCSYVLLDTGKRVKVGDYRDQQTTSNVAVVYQAICIDDDRTMETTMQVYHQSLHVPGMQTHLINQFQLQANGIGVNPTPLQFVPSDQRTPLSHSIYSEEHGMHIPLTLRGTMSGFTCRKPTFAEVSDPEGAGVKVVHMTSDAPWDPTAEGPQELEETLRDQLQDGMQHPFDNGARELSRLQVRGQDSEVDLSLPLESAHQGPSQLDPGGDAPGDIDRSVEIDEAFGVVRQPVDPVVEDDEPVTLKSLQSKQHHHAALEVDRYAEVLLAELGVSERGLHAMASRLAGIQTTRQRHGFVNAEKLAKNWRIGIEAAKRTVEATTQRAVRDFSNVTGSKRLKPHAWMLDYKRIQGTVYTDTFHGVCKSLRGNLYSQVYATDYQYTRTYPMKQRSDVHETLEDFFRDVGRLSAFSIMLRRTLRTPTSLRGQLES